MKRLITTAAAGAIASAILFQPGFSETQAGGAPQPHSGATQAVDRATAAQLRTSCAFYTNLLTYTDQNHFSGAVTTSQNEIAEGAMQGVLQQVYAEKFTGTGALPESQVQFTDPAKKDKIQSMTIGRTTVTATAASAAMASYADHCAYLDRVIAPLARETGISISRLYEHAINGALSASRDPHTSYMGMNQFREMQQQTRGEFGGLGIEVDMKDGAVNVVSPIDDTPASRAGLVANDLITHIGGVPVKGKTLKEAVDMMRGAIGSSITLTIQRGTEAPFDVQLVRDRIVPRAVRGELVGDNRDTAHIRITTFSDTTTTQLEATMDRLKREADANGTPLQNVVLDFRGNPGGLLDQAKTVSDLFLVDQRSRALQRIREIQQQQAVALMPVPAYIDGSPTVLLLRTPERFGKPANIVDILKQQFSDPEIIAALDRFQELETERDDLSARLPTLGRGRIVAVGKNANDVPGNEVTHVDEAMSYNYEGYNIKVLHNGGSASASEIVAGALQDAGIETVGTTTFGKGSVQTIIPIGPEGRQNFYNVVGALRLTTAAFFPGDTGLSNQGSGIRPTVEVRYNDERDQIAASGRGEAALERSLVSTEQTRAGTTPTLTCSLKQEFAGALSAEELATVPANLVSEARLRNSESGEFEPVKMLDADLACALHRLTGQSLYTDIAPYTPPAPAPAP